MLHVINPAAPCPEYDTLDLATQYTFPLDPFQKHAICAMEKSHNVLVTAKTGLPPIQHLPDCNYWHYTLQLNVYRWFLENLYRLHIEEMYLLVLHPDNKNYKRVRLNRMDEEVDAMLNCRLRAVKEGLKQTVILPLPAKECLMEDDD